MSKLTEKDRRALPLSDFAEPDQRGFPIVDEEDVRDAAHLIGHAQRPAAVKKRIIAIAKRKGLALPEAWESGKEDDDGDEDAAMSFSLCGEDGGDCLTAVFGLPSHGATADFRTVADGFAIYENALLFRAGDYPDKKFAITPAELSAAASSWQTMTGNIEHTDFMRGRAAVMPKAWTDDGGATLRGEVRIPLALDDLLTDNERKLSMEWDRATKKPKGFALVTRPRVSDAVLMSLDKGTLPEPATDPAPPPKAVPTPTLPKSDPNKGRSFISPPAKQVSQVRSAYMTAAERIARKLYADKGEEFPAELAASFSAERTKAVERDATAFFSSAVQSNKLLPRSKDLATALFSILSEYDTAADATVTFSAGTKVYDSSVEMFKAFVAAIEPHKLTEETIPSSHDPAFAMNPDGNAAKKDEAKMTPAKDIYAARAKAMRGEA